MVVVVTFLFSRGLEEEGITTLVFACGVLSLSLSPLHNQMKFMHMCEMPCEIIPLFGEARKLS